MINRRWRPVVTAIALAALLGWGAAARSQMGHPQTTPGSFPGQLAPADDGDAVITHQMLARQAAKRNQERQAQLVQDTNRLFDLAKELKEQVGKTNEDVLSVDVVKKADEIEKLAKSVRDKMKAD